MTDTSDPASKPDRLRDKDFENFRKSIGRERDATMLVLRAQLFSESLLERLLPLKLPRGDKLVEHASFSFAQKLVIVEALDCLGDPVVSSLRNLNKLRNQCAHELGKAITDADVTRVGSPLGKFFTKTRRDANHDPLTTLRVVVSYVCGFVTGVCQAYEEHRSKQEPDEKAVHESPNAPPPSPKKRLSRSDPAADAGAYFPDGTRTLEETQQELEWFRHGHPNHPRLGLWATVERSSGAFLGRCGLLPWEIEGRHEVELAFLIDKPRWGEGFATEAATAIANHARTVLGIQRLICLIMPGNSASVRVAQKVGMAFERELIDEHGLCYVYSCSPSPAR